MVLALLSLGIWVYLVALHGRFWSSRPELDKVAAFDGPAVDIIVPARNEAATIAPVIRSLTQQDYRGPFRVILVDDNSDDGTGKLAGVDARLSVLKLESKPEGWSGKLWALEQGVASSSSPVILFADADIVHAPEHLSTLMAKMHEAKLGMVSEMVRLNCVSLAEKALIPAFVYFFQMLYPFARVNDRHSKVAAAAGGTVLIRREVLVRLGGIGAIRHTLIDDVALAHAAKKIEPIFLGHSGLATSIRPYPQFADIWAMIARTAFTQLRFSALLLLLTLIGLTMVWLVPAEQWVAGHDVGRASGAAACILAFLSYQPTLRRYKLNPAWGLLLPLIAVFYMAATTGSALNHWRGTGARWKDRAYGS